MEEQDGHGRLRDILRMMKNELRSPFADPRKPFAPPEVKDLFTELTGETDKTLQRGTLVSAVVTSINPLKGVSVQLETGLRGFVPLRDLSDDTPPSVDPRMRPRSSHGFDDDEEQDQMGEAQRELERWLSTRVVRGQTIQARVMKVNYDLLLVDLSCKSRDIRRTDWEKDRSDLADKYIVTEHPDDAKLGAELSPQELAARSRRFLPRSILHPMFHNMSRQDAVQQLSEKDDGAFIFRPSSKGVDHLTLTYRVSEDTFFDVDIKELEKPSPSTLGARLQIGKQTFEDLDEIIDRFYQPMIHHAKELTKHSTFRFGSEDDVEPFLRVEKQSKPEGIPYLFSFATAHVGMIAFSYLPGRSVHRMYVGLTPQGYSFKNKTYPNPRLLIDALKREVMRKMEQQKLQQQQQQQQNLQRQLQQQHQPPLAAPPPAGMYPDYRYGAHPPARPMYPPTQPMPYAGPYSGMPSYLAPSPHQRPAYPPSPAAGMGMGMRREDGMFGGGGLRGHGGAADMEVDR